MSMDIIEKIIVPVVGPIIHTVTGWIIKPLINRITPIFRRSDDFRQIGLKRFLPLDHFGPLRILETALESVKPGDEMLIAGRTHRGLLRDLRSHMLEAMKNGLRIKVVMLNPQSTRRKEIVLDCLQLENTEAFLNDLEASKKSLHSMCEEAKNKGYIGGLEVRFCEFTIFNSVVAIKHSSNQKIQVVLDFSFGQDRASKFQQYYESSIGNGGQFVDRLLRFYDGFFSQGRLYESYDGNALIPGSYMINERLLKFCEEYDGSEALRHNAPRTLVRKVPDLFASIEKGCAPGPISVQLEVTTRCRKACTHCNRSDWPQGQDLSGDEVKRVIGELADMGVGSLTISGGEPCERADLSTILRYARERDLKTGVLTNGLEIDGQMAYELIQLTDWVRISLDASNDEEYDRIRGVVGGFDKALGSLKLLEEASAKSGHRCQIAVSYCIQRSNIASLENAIDVVKAILGNDREVIIFKFAHGKEGSPFLCRLDQLHHLDKVVFNNRQLLDDPATNLKYLAHFRHHYSSDGDIADGVPLRSYFQRNEVRCFTPYIFSLIDATGGVYPCCFLFHDNDGFAAFQNKREQYLMGNLKTRSFRDIWTGDNYREIRRRMEHIEVDKYRECARCTRHYLHNTFLTKLMAYHDENVKEAGPQTAAEGLRESVLDLEPGNPWL